MSWNARRAVLADTGPLYAAVDPTDQYHLRAQGDLQRLEASRLHVIVAQSTLVEAHSLVLRRLGPRRALAWLDDILPVVHVVEFTSDDFEAAVNRLRALPDQELSLFDALVAVIGERTGIPVWTYDHHFDVMRVPVWR